MNYEIIAHEKFELIKKNARVVSSLTIDFNFATAYFLKDSSVLVQPLNPFGKCLLIKDRTTFDEFIQCRSFPKTMEIENIYDEYRHIFINFITGKKDIINILYQYTYNKNYDAIVTLEQIEEIYAILLQKKKISKFKIYFILLVGDFIIQHNLNYKWGILEIKQLINPIYKIVLVTNELQKEYFNLEYEIEKKAPLFGIKRVISRSFSSFIRSDEFESLIPIQDLPTVHE
jgi:hypothetical protein